MQSISRPHIVFVLGRAGVGKGTICDMLQNLCGLHALSAGSLLREEASRDSPLGQTITKYMRAGELVPCEITTELLYKKIMESPEKTFLIDGWPSSIDRMQTWNEKVGECDAVLWFTCEEDDRISRLKQRGREDDTSDMFEVRNKTYETFIKPVVEHYDSIHKMHLVSTHGSVNDSYERAHTLLKNLLLIN